jgi:serine/threonine protein kinase
VKAGRFLLRRHRGAGGFGDVYEAFDHHHGDTVALKVLRRADATALYRFKQEFGSLANLSHPNLVSLHEPDRVGQRVAPDHGARMPSFRT